MKRKLNLSFTIFLIVLAFASLRADAQINYEVPRLKAYLTFYKNGASFYMLNDSIKTSLYKLSNKSFVIKFYNNQKLIKECPCRFEGNERQESVNILRSSNGKNTFYRKKIKVRQLALKDNSCFNFLPLSVLKE